MNSSNKTPKPGQWTVYVEPEMIHLASILDHKAGGYLVRNTTQANARLIAAAPELLEAVATLYTLANLEMLLKTKYSAPLVQDIMRMMERALTKARGES